jgi:hypothetical protein
VGLPAAFFDVGEAADLSNIGTLFAFLLVSLGVLFLRKTDPDRPRSFRVPLVPLFPIISVILCVGLMSGLLVLTWVRFFVWLAIGLIIFFSWSRYWSEFADPAFRRLLEEESRMRAAMTPAQEQIHKRQRKRPGLAWLLTALFGVLGAHLYYLKHAGRGLLRTGVFGAAVLLKVLNSSIHNQATFYILLLCASALVIFSLADLITIVRRTQEFNVLTARTIAEGGQASV